MDAPAAAAEERTVLLLVQFEGTGFAGWQRQPRQRTVEGVLADALRTMVRHDVTLYSSSRTDAGVHARAMPVSFNTARSIPPHGFLRGLNALLPPDVAVVEAREVPRGWRPRDNALAKTYRYLYQLGQARRPLVARHAWFVRQPSYDLDAMRLAASSLEGMHDFSAFRASACVSKSTERHLYAVEVAPVVADPELAPLVELRVTGNAFLQHMVRIIAGTLHEVGRGYLPAARVAEILDGRDRREAGQTAPACGLTLVQVHFDGYPRLGKTPAVGVDEGGRR